ncbi:hypothetical protein J6500_28395 [Bradyrhizobium sp. WSM 1704]|uniref:hypothetical protein n=1 Tax=Bradyrhizobium semiaridum TaxID=2821404 RepID=UPI001CE2591B|nr:hypothetical protein [Bradyrhizobium semiaridum]MCA6125785.1 hypothetical protein [Bradyrhizobium semiaridum]
MNQKIKFLSLAAASLLATTAGAYAQGYVYESDMGPAYSRYEAAPPPVAYYPAQPGWYGAFNGTNHPTPSSTQGDVGPQGNNNGTLTGVYRRW